MPETYQWLLVPIQATPQSSMEWQAIRLSGSDPLAMRASKKLRSNELLLTGFAATRLRMELDRIPLWRDDRQVAVKQLVQDFARYLYLPRLQKPDVLVEGVSLLTWPQDSFALADSFDDAAGRYRGLRGGRNVSLSGADSTALLVKPEVARKQLDAEAAAPAGGTTPGTVVPGTSAGPATEPDTPAGPGAAPQPPNEPGPVPPKRFHGTVTLDPSRVGRDASRVPDEVIAHLVGLVAPDRGGF